MGQITLTLPQSNLPNATEDPKIISDFTLIQNVINGNLDPSNLSPTGGIMRLAARNTASNTVAATGELIITTAVPVTVTLPAPVANGLVGVISCGFASGASPTTVAGTNIFGVGVNGATSFKLGAPFATVVLQSDGTNWFIVAGQQDTGWVTMALVNNWIAVAGFTPATRLVGDRVWLRGGVDGSGASSTTVTTLAAAFRPTAGAHLGTVGAQINVPTSGVMTCPTGVQLGLDGTSYALS